MGKILVIGSLNVDMVMNVDHMPAEGETILCDKMTFVPGGKGANQARAVGRLGSDVTMFGCIGDDEYGKLQIESLTHAGVNVSGIICKPTEHTGMAFITVNSKGNNSIVVVPGANATFSPEDIDAHRELIETCEIVILQLEIPLQTVCYAAKLAKSLEKTVILDPAPMPSTFPEELYQYIDIIKPNETEMARLTGEGCELESIRKAVGQLENKGVQNILVTLGEQGAYLKEKDKSVVLIPSRKVKAVDTTAAGDAFTAALAVMLLEKKSLTEAAEFASLVSSIVVTRHGAQSSIPTIQEIKTLEDTK